ncbi:MAG TPA: ubiquitin-conjugating enzyme E2 [Tepidisphaeraceae bacterium]
MADDLAGRKARCKSCGAVLMVPGLPADNSNVTSSPQNLAAAAANAPKVPMRTRRLAADAQQMARAFGGFPLVKIVKTEGEPADLYQIVYMIEGLERGPGEQVLRRDKHVVEIELTGDYPRLAPKCRILTPIFHPNFDAATICVGDHWTAGERLVDLVIRIGEMIAFQEYNIKSPLDAEAAMWADLNADKLPIDARPVRPAGLE